VIPTVIGKLSVQGLQKNDNKELKLLHTKTNKRDGNHSNLKKEVIAKPK